MDQEHPVFIAVIPPDATEGPSINIFQSHRSKGDSFDLEYHSPSPGTSPGLSYDGNLSDGYPSPETPLDSSQPSLGYSPYLDNGLDWPDPTSPSLLSLNFLDLNDNKESSQYEYSQIPENSLNVDQAQLTRMSLSPLTIPSEALPSPQPSTEELFNQFFTDLDNGPPFDNSAFNGGLSMDCANSLEVPIVDDMLHPRQRRPSASHTRTNSEMHMPWSGSASPSLVLTPSEPNSSSSFLLGGPDGAPSWDLSEDYTLVAASSISRRHSHTGVGGRRGRMNFEGRSPSSSRGSSRGSSPYQRPIPLQSSSAGPILGPTGMSISPTQVFGNEELSQHLTVPVPSHMDHVHQRRHSFHQGARPDARMYPQQMGSTMGMDNGVFINEAGIHGQDCQVQSPMSGPLTPISNPSTPTTPSRHVSQVASAAGISASERRRVKVAKFQCHLCPQTFTTNHNLKNHINAHLGIKDHQCEHCSRAFTTASVLARHCKTCKSAPHHP